MAPMSLERVGQEIPSKVLEGGLEEKLNLNEDEGSR